MTSLPTSAESPATRPALRVAVLLPCLNEEATIGSVVEAFRSALPDARIHVCDNGSDDRTAEVARNAGATVIVEPARGKGRAIRCLFREVDADVYVMADGDGTYDAAAADRLVARLADEGLEMLVASRKRADADAWTPLRRLGNRLFTALARWRCGSRVDDLLSGYRAFSRRYVERFPARSDGFEVETEMTLFAASSGLAWAETPSLYFARPQGSASKLEAFHDGFRILRTLLFRPNQDMGHKPSAPVGARRAAALIGAVTLAATAVFLALNWFAVRSDPEPVAHALRASFEQPGPAISFSPERFNDCLLSLMTLDRGGSVLELAVSGRRVYRYTRPQRPCDALDQRLVIGAVDDADYLTVFYHQYWAGQRTTLHWLLPWLGFEGLRRTLRLVTVSLLWLGLAGAFFRAMAASTRSGRGAADAASPSSPAPERQSSRQPGGSRTPRREALFGALASAALFFCLLVFLDLNDRAASFTTGFPNILTFALILAIPLLDVGKWKPHRQILLFGVFGAMIAYFELLFGSALIGFAVLLLALAVAPPPTAGEDTQRPQRHADLRSWRRRLLIRCTAAYVGCFSGVFLLRVVIAELVFREPVLFKFWDQLTHRLYGAPRSSIHPEIDPFYAGRPTLERTLERVGEHLGAVGLGSSGLALVLIGGAAATVIVAAFYVLRRWWTLEDPWRWAGILAAGWSVPAWYAVFFAHTQAHVPVMIRLLALPYAAAAMLLLGALMFRRRPAEA